MFNEGKKKCNKVWQIFSINSNDDALAHTLNCLLDPKCGLLLMSLMTLDLVSGFGYLKSEHQSTQTNNLFQSLNSEL
jgi:hypothetical protein